MMFEEKAAEMKKSLSEYIKILREVHYPGGQPEQHIAGVLEVDTNDWPKAPRPPSWEKVKKIKLERTYRMYMTRHYRKSDSFKYKS